jgi:hypothetical protein
VSAPRELLEQILEELRALRAELAAARSQRVPGIPAADQALVRAIFAVLPMKAFAAWEIADYARDRNLKRAPELEAAVLAAVGSLSSRRIGKRLKRLEGADVDGLRVVRDGQDREGAIWSVRELRV